MAEQIKKTPRQLALEEAALKPQSPQVTAISSEVPVPTEVAEAAPSVDKGVEILKSSPQVRQAVKENIGEFAAVAEAQPTPEVQSEALRAIDNPAKIDKIKEKDPAQHSVGDKFALAIAAFAPTLLGALFGGAEGGAAAAQGTLTGAQAGLGLVKGFQDIELAERETALKEKTAKDKASQVKLPSQKVDLTPSARSLKTGLDVTTRSTTDPKTGEVTIEHIEVGTNRIIPPEEKLESLLDIQQKEISQRQQSAFEEKRLERTNSLKKEFKTQKSVLGIEDALKNLSEMETLIASGSPIAKGVIPFKIAKGIAEEVGNLNRSEVEAASNIAGGILNKIRSKSESFFTGALSAQEVAELNRLIPILRESKQKRLREKIVSFSSSRSKTIGGLKEEDLRDDLLSEAGLFDLKAEKENSPRNELEQLRKKHKRN